MTSAAKRMGQPIREPWQAVLRAKQLLEIAEQGITGIKGKVI